MIPLLLALVVGVLPAADQPREVFRFTDPQISEASGLLDLGDTMVVTNDSGDDPVLYVVDAETGETVGRTTYHDGAVLDVEALAPEADGVAYVGDIGDNRRARETVRVHLVPVGRGEHQIRTGAFELRYPDGPHDAESLFVDASGRLHVVTKGLLGGAVYAAPHPLDPGSVVELRKVTDVGIFATDAAGVPGSSLVLVRGYGSAVVLDLATGRQVGRFGLPEQPQGEAISVGPEDRIRVTSEGAGAAVIEVPAPDWLPPRIAASRLTTAAADGVSSGTTGAMLEP